MDAEIDAVLAARTDDGPVGVVVLAVDGASDVLPIAVGMEAAASIVRGLEAADADRPRTHDLLLDAVEAVGGRLDRVVVSSPEAGSYAADLHLETPRDGTVLDARPSDSLALASRTGVPIEVETGAFEAGRRPAEEFDGLRDVREVAEGA